MGKPIVIATRSYTTDLQYSLSSREEDFWREVYKRAFPNLIHTELCEEEEKQKQGVDRVLYLANGNVLYVDEKKRSRAYPDILLEYKSAAERDTPGWIAKDLAMDYLAYAIMPTKTAYLFPWPMLRRVWMECGEQWVRQYRTVEARTYLTTGFYTTLSVAVPLDVLQRAVTNASVIRVC